MKVFEVDEMLCFKFHIDRNLSEKKRKEYLAKIIKNGGEVIPLPSDDVLTLTTKKLRDGFSYDTYDIKYIDDCIEAGKVLDIGKYGLNEIPDYGCPMSLLLFGEKYCPVVEILRSRLSAAKILDSRNPSPNDSPSTSSARRVDRVEDDQLIRILDPAELNKTPKKKGQEEILENHSTPKKTQINLTSPTVVKNFEKRGVSILRSAEKRDDNKNEIKRGKISLSLPVKDKELISKTTRRNETEIRIDEDEEDQEVDINALMKQVTQGRKEKEKRALERILEEAKEKKKMEEEEKKRQEMKEQERMKEKLEEARKEQERKEELERQKQEELERRKQEEMEEKRRKEKRDQEEREKFEREKLEFRKEMEREKQELIKQKKELEEREEQERKAKKKEPIITKVVKVVLDRTIDSQYQSQQEITPGKRFLSSFDADESLRECKRPKKQETQPQEGGDSQSSMDKSSNLPETSDSSAEMRPFTQITRVSTQQSTTDSSEAIFGSYEYQDEDFQSQSQFIDEKQVDSGEMDAEDSERYKIVGGTQNILDDLNATVDSLGNNEQLSEQENVEGSLEKIQEIQEKIQDSEEKVEDSQDMMTEEDSSPLLDDVSKAALLHEDSETDFESANDTPPNVDKNFDSDVIIVEENTSVGKSTDENMPEKSTMDKINMKRRRNKSLDYIQDDYDEFSEAETIILSQVRGRPDLIPKPVEQTKEVKKKVKLVGLKNLFASQFQDQDDSFEDPRKQVMEKDNNEEKENVEKSAQSENKPTKSRWSFLFP